MNTLTKENINIAVDTIKKIPNTDLADLCAVTETDQLVELWHLFELS